MWAIIPPAGRNRAEAQTDIPTAIAAPPGSGWGVCFAGRWAGRRDTGLFVRRLAAKQVVMQRHI